jgi:predicted dinucleotide-utilizing enzyme
MGRLKFLVKDFRSDKTSANMDQKNEASPIKKSARCEDIDDFAEEEEVEIECGIADASDSIQCKICWSDE